MSQCLVWEHKWTKKVCRFSSPLYSLVSPILQKMSRVDCSLRIPKCYSYFKYKIEFGASTYAHGSGMSGVVFRVLVADDTAANESISSRRKRLLANQNLHIFCISNMQCLWRGKSRSRTIKQGILRVKEGRGV